jgi:endoglucanase
MSYMVGYGAWFPRQIHHHASLLSLVVAYPTWIGCKTSAAYYASPKPNSNLLVSAIVSGPNDTFPDTRATLQL